MHGIKTRAGHHTLSNRLPADKPAVQLIACLLQPTQSPENTYQSGSDRLEMHSIDGGMDDGRLIDDLFTKIDGLGIPIA